MSPTKSWRGPVQDSKATLGRRAHFFSQKKKGSAFHVRSEGSSGLQKLGVKCESSRACTSAGSSFSSAFAESVVVFFSSFP